MKDSYFKVDWDDYKTPKEVIKSKKNPYCNCNKGKIDEKAQIIPSLKVTKSDDGETCSYCGYYATFLTEEERKNL